MAVTRVSISSLSIPTTVTDPTWKGEFAWEREKEQVFYRFKLRSEVTFYGADFALIEAAPDCEDITLSIERQCGGSWTTVFTGKFTKYDCKFDLDRCTVKVTPKPEDEYKCILNNWTDEENIYNASAVTEVRGVSGVYQADVYNCRQCRATPDLTPCTTHTDACIEPGWPKVVAYPSPNCSEPNRFEVWTFWHREIGTGTTTTPPPYGSGWTYISGNNWWRCPDQDNEMQIGVLRTGRIFNATLTYIIGLTGCGLTVRSHFFGINATHAAPPDNVAYEYAEAKLRHITIHQKSDVKRPDNDPAFSQVWLMKLKELLDDLREIFNVYWLINGTDLVLEHISYFQAAVGPDYSNQNHPLQYEQTDDGAPRKEIFKWSDDIFGIVHAGYPIEYGCGEGDKERRVKLFTCDVLAVRQSANAENIADKNFVLCANYLVDGQYIVYPNNTPLGWRDLHDNLHRHDRYFLEGNMNNVATTFLTAKKNRKLKPIVVPLCCEDTFDPTASPTTDLGAGEVRAATYNIHRDTLSLELLV